MARSTLFCALAWLALATTAYGQFGAGSFEAPQGTTDPRVAPVVSLSRHERAGFERGMAALGRPVRGRFLEIPLVDAIKRLESDSGCSLQIDERALADAAIGVDTLVTYDLETAPLRTVLDGILRPHALAWIPRSPGLLITTQEQADTNPDYRQVVIYPVHDLVSVRTEQGIEYDFYTLIDAITTVIHAETWKEGGTGEGTIEPLPSVVGISIQQTWDVHEDIFALLSGMREVKAKLPYDPLTSSTREPFGTMDANADRYTYRPSSRRRQRVYWSTKDVPTPPTRARSRISEEGGVF